MLVWWAPSALAPAACSCLCALHSTVSAQRLHSARPDAVHVRLANSVLSVTTSARSGRRTGRARAAAAAGAGRARVVNRAPARARLAPRHAHDAVRAAADPALRAGGRGTSPLYERDKRVRPSPPNRDSIASLPSKRVHAYCVTLQGCTSVQCSRLLEQALLGQAPPA